MPKGESTRTYYVACRERGGFPALIEGPFTRIDHAIKAMSLHQEHRPRIEYTVTEIVFPSDLEAK